MKFMSFFSARSKRRGDKKAKSFKRTRRSRGLAPALERLEDRTLMSVLPPPLVSNQLPIAAFRTAFSPMVAQDPNNPQNLVAVAAAVADLGDATTGNEVLTAAFSTNGGKDWVSFINNPGTATSPIRPSFLNLPDPTLNPLPNPPSPPIKFAQLTNPAVTFDRAGNFYILVSEHNVDSTNGALVLHKYNFNSGAVTPVFTNHVLHAWIAQDPVYNPIIAIDNNVATFTDPQSGLTNADSLANLVTLPDGSLAPKAIYIAWNTDNTAPTPPQGSPPDPFFNPNTIKVMASSDGGRSFSGEVLANDGGNSFTSLTHPNRSSRPVFTFTEGSADGRVPGGELVMAWSNFSSTLAEDNKVIADISRPDGGSATTPAVTAITLTGNTGPILEPPIDDTNGDPLTPTPFTTTQALNITDPNFVLNNINVTLTMVHPHLNQVRIRLIAPDGTAFTLVRNGVDNKGTAFNPTQGLPDAANLGIQNLRPEVTGTTFDDFAPRRIQDPSATTPWIGHFRPEVGSLRAAFAGRTAAQLNGTWTLEITDFRNDRPGQGTPPPTQFVRSWSVSFTSYLSTTGFAPDVSIQKAVTVPGSKNDTYTTQVLGAPAGAPGIGPGITLATDNTLGSFSPYQGRIYLAYTGFPLDPTRQKPFDPNHLPDNTDVFLIHSDDGGRTWSTAGVGDPTVINDDTPFDNFSEGRRPQFMPALAVDPTTGTLVVTFYDARWDAARNRFATFMATSLDGGTSFAPETFLNLPKTAIDAITGTKDVLEPTAANLNNVGPFGFGESMGLVVNGGHVIALWAGNYNAPGSTVDTAITSIAAGPRIISSDMGPVVTDSVAPGNIVYNNTFAADGTRQLDAFTVTFDRPVDAQSFTPAQVTMTYRDPFTPAGSPGVPVSIASVTPLDGLTLFGPRGVGGKDANGNFTLATQFLVRLTTPQKGIGTYSYTIGPNVRDRLRSGKTTVIPSGPPSTVNATDLPKAITSGNNFTTSSLTVTAPLTEVVNNVKVTLNVTYPFVQDLRLTLIAPDGTRVPLVLENTTFGANYGNGTTSTTFDDAATTPINNGTAPFAGTFKPQSPLSAMVGHTANGTWSLEVNDTFPFTGTSGTFNSWSLTIQTGTLSSSGSPGNPMDQNANANPGEANFDAFAIPRPLNGIPGSLPYDQNTLPLIIPGAHVASTGVTGDPATPTKVADDNLVLNQTNSYVDVLFDRDINPATFQPSSILRMQGPIGVITGPFTVTANPPGTPAALAKRLFRIGFPTQTLSGTYTLVFAPSMKDTLGNAVDVNLNAGLDVLRGVNPTSAATVPIVADSGTLSLSLPPGRTTEALIQVDDNFPIQSMTARLNISAFNDPDLEASLVGPDGTVVRLFTNVGQVGSPPFSDFQDTTFDDAASTPIQLGRPPFNIGRFNPQTPLSAFRGKNANGVWHLVIKNDSSVNTSTLNNWSLTFQKSLPGTGLGEVISDQFTVHFRIFVMDTQNPQSHQTWTAVGPASENSGGNSGRVSGLALDPSDPSGNTVYAGGASGGIWKTTNFLTTDRSGPTWIPLTDFGPTTSLNIGGIAVFGRNNDPNQSIVFAATGEGDTNTPGVGFLRSMDGGRTWQVLDSTVNTDALGNVLAINSAARDHKFVGSTSFKIAVDPNRDPQGNIIVYAALSGRNGGLWRSNDSGNTWFQVRAGQATDLVLAAGGIGANGNLQKLYVAFRGEGVFFTDSATTTTSMTLLAGAQGNPLTRDVDVSPDQEVPVNAPTGTPNGAKGRIVLAAPALTGSPLLDSFYQGWLYAAVATTDGHLDGLYLTKDFGRNWTKVRLPAFRPAPKPPLTTPNIAFATNDTSATNTDIDPLGSQNFAQGNYDIALAVDPNNPNVVYLGGTDDGQPQPAGGFIRVDTTGIADPYAFVPNANSNPDGGAVQANSQGRLILSGSTFAWGLVPFSAPVFPLPKGSLRGYDRASGEMVGYLNMLRDPDNPFLVNSTLKVQKSANFLNNGFYARWQPFNDFLTDSTDQHRLLTLVDPVTGHTRLIAADDQGVFTGVDDGTGNLIGSLGSLTVPTGSRNGNLQIAQFYYGASQPSNLAAQIAGAFFYGMAQDDGFPESDPNILSNGNLNWNGPGGDGTGVATDQTGSGTVFQFRWPCCGSGEGSGTGLATDFFKYIGPGASPYVNPDAGTISRTFGLLQAGDDPVNNRGQWPFLGGSNFAYNPIDPNGLAISSQAGRIFRSTDQGKTWFAKGEPGDLDGSYAPAIAFGAPDPTKPGVLDDFIYAGTKNGHIFVTFVGGGFNGSTQWKNISAGLDTSAVQQIVTNPRRGSHEAYAVTLKGVYWMEDSSAANPTWVNVTGNLFALNHNVFLDPTNPDLVLQYLTTIQADWRFTIPDDPTNPTGPTHPVLYVAGEGGVYRSKDKGQTWTPFPDVAHDGAPADFGYLPNAHVTALSLAAGNINPATGQPNQSFGPNILLATTFGRGSFAIRLDNNLAPGPRVVSFTPTGPQSPGLTSVTVTFNNPVDPSSLTPSAVLITGPKGPIAVTAVTDVTPLPPPGQPNLHNVFQISFPALNADGVYVLTILPSVMDFSGNHMDQNGNGKDGEDPGDRFTAQFVVNSTDNGRFLSGLYHDLLNRAIDTAAFINAITPLENARFAVLPGIAGSAIFNTRSKLIADLYNLGGAALNTTEFGLGDLLPRAATAGEINSVWLPFLNSGGTVEAMIASLMSDPLYFTQNRTGHAVGGNDTGFITQVYTDLLHRAVGPGELSFWQGQLGGPEKAVRQQIIAGLLTDPGYLGPLVQSFYQAYLGRAASTTGAVDPGTNDGEQGHWIRALQAGLPDEQLQAILLGSAEYLMHLGTVLGHAPSTAEFVTGVYKSLFPRYAVSAGEVNFWVGQLVSGLVSRQGMATSLLTSDLYRTGNNNPTTPNPDNLVTGYYNKFLGRNPTTTELAGWLTAMQMGLTDEGVIAGILSDLPYFTNSRVQGAMPPTDLATQEVNWIKQSYQDLLNRQPGAGEISFQQSRLTPVEIAARKALVTSIESDPSYRAAIINYAFTTFDGRPPTATELATWQNNLAAPPNGPGMLNHDEELLAAIFGSQEYFFNHPDANGLHTNQSWVDSLFTNLHRTNATENATLVANLEAAYAPQRLAAAAAVTSSAEYRTNLVNQYYNSYLGRAPSVGEINFWLGQFAAGFTTEQFQARLLGTVDYLNNLTKTLGHAPSTGEFVSAVYLALFPRYAVSAGEINFWTGLLNGGMISRENFALTLLTSSLYRTSNNNPTTPNPDNLITGYYNKFLGRNPSTGELAFWLGQMQAGMTDEQVIDIILSDPSYFMRTHPFP
jgi:subtilisin-like proprotein convertase family protein